MKIAAKMADIEDHTTEDAERLATDLKERDETIKKMAEKTEALQREVDKLNKRIISPDNLPVMSKHEFVLDIESLNDVLKGEVRTDIVKLGDVDVSFGATVETRDNVHFAKFFPICKSDDTANPRSVLITTEYELKSVETGTTKHTAVERFVVGGKKMLGYAREARVGSTWQKVEGKMSVSIVSVKVNNIEMPEEDLKIILDGKEMIVKSGALMLWSDFFRGYFKTPMKERVEGTFPVKGVHSSDFEELLSVIYPPNKPIDYRNVEKMLELADRFLMPALTRKCELFLSDIDQSEFSKSYLFTLSDRYHLGMLTTVLFERWRNVDLFQKELLFTKDYDNLPIDTKHFVGFRYVEMTKLQKK